MGAGEWLEAASEATQCAVCLSVQEQCVACGDCRKISESDPKAFPLAHPLKGGDEGFRPTDQCSFSALPPLVLDCMHWLFMRAGDAEDVHSILRCAQHS